MVRKKSVPERKYHHGDVRKSLISAALDLTEESGLESLSMRELARRIGISTAAPYFHFKDRQSLLIEIAVEGYRELLGELESAREGAEGAREKLARAAAAYLRFSRNHRAHYAIMFSGQFAGNDRFEEMMGVASKSLELVGKDIAGGGGVKARDAGHAAFCAWSLLHGIAMLNQNGILSESAKEQESLGVRGVLSLASAF